MRRLAQFRRPRSVLLALGLSLVAAHVATARNSFISVAPGATAVALDGVCSFPEAVANALADAQPHVDCYPGSPSDAVVLAAGSTYVFDQALGQLAGPAALPLVDAALIIRGRDSVVTRSGACTLDGVADAGEFRFIAATAALTIEGVEFRNGCADGGYAPGGAIFAETSVRLRDVRFVGNRARASGGALAAGFATNVVHDHRLAGVVAEDNQAREYGGFAALRNGPVEIITSSFHGNRGAVGGALDLGQRPVRISGTWFGANEATQRGGALVVSGPIEVFASTFHANQALATGGGAILVSSAGDLSLDFVTFAGNSAPSGTGSAVWLSSGAVRASMHGVVLHDETCATSGGPSLLVAGAGNVQTRPECGNLAGGGFATVSVAALDLQPVSGHGAARTLAPGLASAALDLVDCTSFTGVPRRLDQRGFARPEGGACDAGAHERPSPEHVATDGFETPGLPY